MRDLPFYNSNLEVEAFGFSDFNDGSLIGVLITPWFMNLVVMPLRFEQVQTDRYGQSRAISLPSGERKFRYGGDEVVGAFWADSLYSPMQNCFPGARARRGESTSDRSDEAPVGSRSVQSQPSGIPDGCEGVVPLPWQLVGLSACTFHEPVS